MKMNKDGYGKVASENVSGKGVPRKSGLTNETTGKGAGKGSVRGPKRSPFDFVGKGR